MSPEREEPNRVRTEGKGDEDEQRNNELEAIHKATAQSQKTSLGDRLRKVLEVRILN